MPLLLPAEQAHLFHDVEDAAASWFKLSEEQKLGEAGSYGHVDRKFTGYRNGKFREQLEIRHTLDTGHAYPPPATPAAFTPALETLMARLDGWARSLLRHVARDLGASEDFFDEWLDPVPPTPGPDAAPVAPPAAAATAADDGDVDDPVEEPPPPLAHSLIRVCRYDAASDGVYGSNVLCEQHNDVGFLTLDAAATTPGLEALRRSDGLWVPIEQATPPADGSIVVMCMVGDTLARLTANHYTACKHRVVAPRAGERIGTDGGHSRLGASASLTEDGGRSHRQGSPSSSVAGPTPCSIRGPRASASRRPVALCTSPSSRARAPAGTHESPSWRYLARIKPTGPTKYAGGHSNDSP